MNKIVWCMKSMMVTRIMPVIIKSRKVDMLGSKVVPLGESLDVVMLSL
jgi:hypothetical protein